jgi:hypothetical protein
MPVQRTYAANLALDFPHCEDYIVVKAAKLRYPGDGQYAENIWLRMYVI